VDFFFSLPLLNYILIFFVFYISTSVLFHLISYFFYLFCFCKSFISFKFAKYQRIYRRNISVGNLRSKLPTDTFPSVIQSVTTDEIFSVCNSVGNYRRKVSVGSYRLNYGRKSFRIKKKAGRWRGGFGGLFVFRRNHRRIQNDSPYSARTVTW
jgi:hypothetical protein